MGRSLNHLAEFVELWFPDVLIIRYGYRNMVSIATGLYSLAKIVYLVFCTELSPFTMPF